MEFFYDSQVRRYLEQFMRLFSGLSVRIGVDERGIETFQRVPVKYGDASRMASSILRNNSENFLNSVPAIAIHIANLSMADNRRMNPTHQEKVQVYEKKFNPTTGKYTSGQVGDTYTIERYMPVPYELTLNVDVWTSNTDQKLQLVEQLLVLFNPSVNIRSSSNAFDWSALTYVEMKDVTWSSRTVPVGADDQIDVATISFMCPIYINPPAKVKRLNSVTNVVFGNTMGGQGTVGGGGSGGATDPNGAGQGGSGFFTSLSFKDHKIFVEEDRIYLLTGAGGTAYGDCDCAADLPPDRPKMMWHDELKPYGEMRPGVSQIRLRKNGLGPGRSCEGEIIGLIDYDPEDDNLLVFTLDRDTLPADTVAPVNGIIDPTKDWPGHGPLPEALPGQRYLIIRDLPIISYWTNLEAYANDIIEFNGSEWFVSRSHQDFTQAYVTNSYTMKKYEWKPPLVTDNQWVHGSWVDAYQGLYSAGYWNVYL
jgi:hypothetical protein